MKTYNEVTETRGLKIEEMLSEDVIGEDAYQLLEAFKEQDVECYLLGGAIRDAFEGRHPRDLDIILADESEELLKSILSNTHIKYTINSFNGYKMVFEKLMVDLWLMKDHYAFKKEYYPENKAYIKRTTFVNYDSLVYDLQTKELDSSYYDDCIRRKTIDLIGKKKLRDNNPNAVLSIIKIILLKQRTNYKLSDSVIDFLAEQYNECGDSLWKKIEAEYKRHYGKTIRKSFMDYIISLVMDSVVYVYERKKGKNDIEGQFIIYDYGKHDKSKDSFKIVYDSKLVNEESFNVRAVCL